MCKYVKIKIINELNYLKFESIRFEKGKYIFIYHLNRYHRGEIKELEMYNKIMSDFDEYLNNNEKSVFDFVKFNINFNNEF